MFCLELLHHFMYVYINKGCDQCPSNQPGVIIMVGGVLLGFEGVIIGETKLSINPYISRREGGEGEFRST